VGSSKVTVETLSEALLHLYSLVPPADDWRPFLDTCLAIFDARSVSMLIIPQDKTQLGMMASSSTDDAAQKEKRSETYVNRYFQSDPFVGLPLDVPITLHEFLGSKNLEDNDYYQHFLKPLGNYFLIGVDVRSESGFTMRFRISRREDKEDFDQEDKEILNLLVPHLQQLVRHVGEYDNLQSEQGVYSGAVELLAVGAAMVKANGQIARSNRIANEILSEGDGVALVDGKIKIADENVAKQFTRILESLDLNEREPGPPAVLRVQRPSGKVDLGLVVRPVVHRTQVHGSDNVVAAVLLSDPDRGGAVSMKALKELFDLTNMEAALTCELAEGLSVSEAAERLNIAVNTARSHLRAIFEKTDTGRQAQLIRLVLKSAAELADYRDYRI
jgi:DNA-binding CsgD family transcriptional regulator